MTQPADFPLFLALWNKVQGGVTPALHFRMARWLQSCRKKGSNRLLLQAFRSSGKSTITGLYAAWLLYANPDLRILVVAADLMLARKMVRNVRRILEKHPLTTHLPPQRADEWSGERFTVNRKTELRDPSMLAKGVTSNLTGTRADVIICDDVEVPNTCDTAAKREELRERLAELSFILTPGGTMLYIGTPHTWYTIYADRPRTEIGETAAFLNGYHRLSIPVLDKTGASAWPERFPSAEIENLRRSSGPSRFSAQMMLEPVNIAEGRIDPAAFIKYVAEPVLYREIGLLMIGDRKIVSAGAWWDPSFGSARGDASVLAAVYTDEQGHYWLHRVQYIKTDVRNEDDEATQQCRAVAQAVKDLMLPSVTVETNGIGRFLPAILRRELAAAHVPCSVLEAASTRAKDQRIIEAFDVVLAARLLHVHESVYATPFMREVQEWRPGMAGERDDGLDAVAGALSAAPVKIKRHYLQGRPLWKGGQGGHTADTEFEV